MLAVGYSITWDCWWKHLHIVSPFALCFLTILYLASNTRSGRGRARERLYPFHDLVIEVTRHHFCLNLLFATTIKSLFGFKESEKIICFFILDELHETKCKAVVNLGKYNFS